MRAEQNWMEYREYALTGSALFGLTAFVMLRDRQLTIRFVTTPRAR